jgi:hypothetical protein
LRVLAARPVEVRSQLGQCARGKDGGAVAATLSVADEDLPALEVDGLHAHARAFEETQPRAVEEERHEMRDPVHATEHGLDLGVCEHRRQAGGSLCAHETVEPWEVPSQHLPIEEEDRGQRLVPSGGGDLLGHRQRRKECRDLDLAERMGMSLAVEQDGSANPMDVGVLRAAAVVT